MCTKPNAQFSFGAMALISDQVMATKEFHVQHDIDLLTQAWPSYDRNNWSYKPKKCLKNT